MSSCHPCRFWLSPQDPPEFPAEESQGAVEPAEAPEALPTAAEEAAEAAEVGGLAEKRAAGASLGGWG